MEDGSCSCNRFIILIQTRLVSLRWGHRGQSTASDGILGCIGGRNISFVSVEVDFVGSFRLLKGHVIVSRRRRLAVFIGLVELIHQLRKGEQVSRRNFASEPHLIYSGLSGAANTRFKVAWKSPSPPFLGNGRGLQGT